MKTRWLLWLGTFLLFSACSAPAGEQESLSPSPLVEAASLPAETTTLSPTPSPAASPLPTSTVEEPLFTPRMSTPGAESAEPAIVLQQEGGFAGVMNRWAIYRDGRIAADGDGLGVMDGEIRMTTERVVALLEAIEDAGYFEIESNAAKSVCCDFFVFTLTVRRDGRETTMVFSEGDESAPEELRLATMAVLDFLSQAGAMGDGAPPES